jgi:epoxyqueuosine reductase
MPPVLTAAAIKARALALGFDLCGIAPVDAHPELAFLAEWLERGYAGDMDWMRTSAANRADVRAIVPGARSVIVTGTVYSVAEGEDASAPLGDTRPGEARGIVARYARGADYHDVLRRRINALLAWMQAESEEPFEARAFVDSGPVQERVYAQYAGLGWIGKNACLINPELGSWLFLGEIICTLALEPDTQGLEQCGSCTRCLDACPTGALVEPGVLDSNRCLSYLTIETEGGIPEPYRQALGARIYGCDICQEVCPYNQPQTVSSDPAWQARPAFDLPRLVDLWRRPDADLRALTRGTAITRAGVTGLRRSLAVAIGNSGDPEAVAALVVPDPDKPTLDDPIVQEHIDWALTRNAKLP